MGELDALERAIGSSPAADKLREAVSSAEGQRVLKNLDTAKVEKAAKAGDMQALKDILSGVLSTPEGQALAQKIRKSMGK